MFVYLHYINFNTYDFFLISTGSGMGSKYLTFLDLGLQAHIFRNIDDGTIAVELPSTFYIGKHTFHNLNVRFSQYLLQHHIRFYFDIDKLKWVS